MRQIVWLLYISQWRERYLQPRVTRIAGLVSSLFLPFCFPCTPLEGVPFDIFFTVEALARGDLPRFDIPPRCQSADILIIRWPPFCCENSSPLHCRYPGWLFLVRHPWHRCMPPLFCRVHHRTAYSIYNVGHSHQVTNGYPPVRYEFLRVFQIA